MSGRSWAQRIAAEGELDAETIQSVLLRAAGLAIEEGLGLPNGLAARMLGLPDDEPVVSAEGAVMLANGSVVEAQAALRRELAARADRLRIDSPVRSLVTRELDDLAVPRRERAQAQHLLYELAALMPGEDVARELERALADVDPVVQMPIREMVRATGWDSLRRWLDLATFWWVA